MESQKIINFLEPDDSTEKYFQTKKWYIINDQSNGQYNENSKIKINTEVIKENICDYGDAYILVTGNVKIIGGNANTKFCFKGISPFTRSVIHLNDTHTETVEDLQLVMKHYNSIEYSDNYQDTVSSLYQFKRDEQNMAGNALTPVTIITSDSFQYKSSLINSSNSQTTPAVGNAGDANYVEAYINFKNVEILVSLKYVSSFFRSLKLPFINTKLHLELSWSTNCIMSTVGEDGNNDTNRF